MHGAYHKGIKENYFIDLQFQKVPTTIFKSNISGSQFS